MVQSTIALAHSLGRKVVAEGVERREILDALIEMKCDVAQGFIIGRPMSLEAICQANSGSRKQEIGLMVNSLLTISIKVNVLCICRIAV